MEIRKLNPTEKNAALKLVWEVFQEFESPDYTQEGTDSFRNYIQHANTIDNLEMLGAFDRKELTGMIATRNDGSHIALFFVRKEHHRQGIGRQLFEKVATDSRSERITVHSSPYAVDIYHRLGFTDTQPEQSTDGIRYTPMVFIR